MATAELTVIGLGRSDPSAGEYIAEIQRRLAAQDRVRFQLHAMGTELEGATDDILAVVADLHGVPFELGLPRVYTVLKLDERRDREQTPRTRCARSRSGSSVDGPGTSWAVPRTSRAAPMRRALGRSAPGPAANVPGCPLWRSAGRSPRGPASVEMPGVGFEPTSPIRGSRV